MLKKIVFSLLILIVLLGILAVAAYFLAKKYEPEVRDIVVYEVNRLLDVEVQVEDINLSLLQRFPYASLRFNKVVIPEADAQGRSVDTLLYIEDLYLQISLWDFLRKQYRISEADVNSGFFRMELFPQGKDNYHFWKSNEQADPAVLSLSNITVNDFRYSYRQGNEIEVSTHIHKAQAGGSFGAEEYSVKASCHLTVKNLLIAKDTLYAEQHVGGDLDFQIDHLAKRYSLHASSLELGKESFEVDGLYDPEQDQAWRISMKSETARIEHIIDLLPQNMKQGLSAYKAKGKSAIVLEASDQGRAPFKLDLLFENTKGSFQHDIALGKAEIKRAAGSLQVRGDVTSLYIDHLDGNLGPGELTINGQIIDFSDPSLTLRVDGNVQLEELRNFFNLTYLDELAGEVSTTGVLQGELNYRNINEHLALLKGISFDGEIAVKDGSIKPRDAATRFEKINGTLRLENNAFTVKKATARVNGNDFSFSGRLGNALPYLLIDDQRLNIVADFKAEHLDLNALWDTDESKRDTSYHFTLPERVSFDFQVNLGEVSFRRFEASGVRGRAIYNNNLLSLNPIQFKMASGQGAGRASVGMRSAELYRLDAIMALEGIEMSELFYHFEDFGQKVVSHEQISGRSDATIQVEAGLTKDLNIDLNSVRAKAEVEIVQGKLKNVASLTDVADYLRSNLVWRSLVRVDAFEKNLQSIDFDTLRNTIEIRDRTVFLPVMRVGSSAMTLNLSGQHTFENQIDYRLNFRLSELFRTGKPRDEEFGYLTDDGTGLRLFLRMVGSVDNPTFEMDRDGARVKRQQDFQREKQTLKGILKDEFGLFKGDSSAIAPRKTQGKNPTFSVSWGDTLTGKDSLMNDSSKTTLKRKRPQFKKESDEMDELLDDEDDM